MDPFLKNAPCGFLTFNDDGIIRHVNVRMGEMLGMREDELIDHHIETIFSPGTAIFYQTHFFPLLRLKKQIEEIYLSLRSKSGKSIPVLTNATRSDYQGEPLNQCIMLPVQQRSEYEDQILEAKRLAEKESDEKGQFLSMMSHELRSPLQAIVTFSDLLLRDASSISPKHEKFLNNIKNAAEDMNRLVSDILNFARLETGRFDVKSVVISVDEAIHRAEQIVLPKVHDKEITFEILESTGLSVFADPDRLHQILINLLTNAIKFTDSGGRVSISCESDNDKVLIHVEDTGVGIPEDKLPKIFTPFMQVNRDQLAPEERGVGLGLAISHELAQIMDGDLTVDSIVGQGSTFTISLPLARKHKNEKASLPE